MDKDQKNGSSILKLYSRAFLRLSREGKLDFIPDKPYLKLMYLARTGKHLDLKHPRSYNEKLQWLKLYDRRPQYTVMVDKYRMRSLVEEKLGPGYVVPLLGVWDSPEEIDFDRLPDQFVLKCNHNSGTGMCICRDKSTLDVDKVRQELKKGLQENYYKHGREWPYKDIPRKILAEEFLVDDAANDGLTDYKFFCFNGQPKVMYISQDFFDDSPQDFFDMDFHRLEFREVEGSTGITEKPACFEQMRQMSQTLSQGIPFLRVDFYFVNGQIYVGELTFYHCSGFTQIRPEEWLDRMGSWICLPEQQV